ncbi:MAG: hypothetical protein ACLUFI_01360 [Oscillospiraceae bacterium]
MYYRSLNAYLRETFGCKVYKLALSAGCTCLEPGRDDWHARMHLLQRQRRICRVRFPLYPGAAGAGQASGRRQGRAGRTLYSPIFRTLPIPMPRRRVLRPLFAAAIRQPEVCALSIATRPDCLPPEILSLLAELRAEKPVWVELGLQTIHASTAAYIRRSYPLSVYDEAVRALHARGISVITHQILSLARRDAGDDGGDGPLYRPQRRRWHQAAPAARSDRDGSGCGLRGGQI